LCGAAALADSKPFVLISKDQEIQIGRESSAAVEKEFGVYKDQPGLSAYVTQVGNKLVSVCGRKDLAYHFTVLDTSVINAFALPGGYVYLTRGILARMNSEDELAAVMGHELAHVALRHGAQEMSRQTVAQLGLQALSILKPGLGQSLGPYAGAALNLAFMGYSRDLEAQADEYGITYAEAAGYNPRGAVKMFQMFKAIEGGEPGTMDKFLASHPPTTQRLSYADGRVGQFAKAHPKHADQPLKREAFLRQIDGLALGNAKADELVQGGVYVHKGLRFGLDFPETYAANLNPEDPDALATFTRLLKTSGGQAQQRVIGLEGKTLQQARSSGEYATRYLANLKVPHRAVAEASVSMAEGRFPAKVLDVTTQSGTQRLLMAFIVRDRAALVVYGFTDPAGFQGARPEFERVMSTLRFIPERELASYQTTRLRLVTTRAGDTWSSLASRIMNAPNQGPRLAIYNGIFNTSRQPESGMLLKIPNRAALKEKA
jgi:predicted Zn-dependent protease